jgi:hypothetical protein
VFKKSRIVAAACPFMPAANDLNSPATQAGLYENKLKPSSHSGFDLNLIVANRRQSRRSQMAAYYSSPADEFKRTLGSIQVENLRVGRLSYMVMTKPWLLNSLWNDYEPKNTQYPKPNGT